MDMPNHERFRLVQGVAFQSMGPMADGVLLSLESGILYRCNPAAVCVIEAIEKFGTSESAVESMCSRFEVETSVAATDTQELLGDLIDQGLIELIAA